MDETHIKLFRWGKSAEDSWKVIDSSTMPFISKIVENIGYKKTLAGDVYIEAYD